MALETLLHAACEPVRFLDLIESFLLFEDARGGLHVFSQSSKSYRAEGRIVNQVRALLHKGRRERFRFPLRAGGVCFTSGKTLEHDMYRFWFWAIVLMLVALPLAEALANAGSARP